MVQISDKKPSCFSGDLIFLKEVWFNLVRHTRDNFNDPFDICCQSRIVQDNISLYVTTLFKTVCHAYHVAVLI